jgi:hypothetical protein
MLYGYNSFLSLLDDYKVSDSSEWGFYSKLQYEEMDISSFHEPLLKLEVGLCLQIYVSEHFLMWNTPDSLDCCGV